MQSINVVPGVPNTTRGALPSFLDNDPFQERNLRISGITKDNAGAILASCVVMLYRTANNQAIDATVSGSDGSYVLTLDKGLSQTQVDTWFVVAYKAGSPDVSGASVNTLTGA